MQARRLLGDEQVRCDLVVRAASAHQPEHLAFPLGETEPVVRARRGSEPRPDAQLLDLFGQGASAQAFGHLPSGGELRLGLAPLARAAEQRLGEPQPGITRTVRRGNRLPRLDRDLPQRRVPGTREPARLGLCRSQVGLSLPPGRLPAPRAGGQDGHAANEGLPLRFRGGPFRRQAQPQRGDLRAHVEVIGVGIGVGGGDDVAPGDGVGAAPDGRLGRGHGEPAPHIRMPAARQSSVDLRQVPVDGVLIATPGGQDDATDQKVADGHWLRCRAANHVTY